MTNPYNILGDYGQAGGRFGTRDSVFLLGTISLPHGIAISPTLQASSGAPYSVTLSKDLLGTSVLNQRPGIVSFGQLRNRSNNSGYRLLHSGWYVQLRADSRRDDHSCELTSGPRSIHVNLRITKAFSLAKKASGGGSGTKAWCTWWPSQEAASVARVARGDNRTSTREVAAARQGEALTAVPLPSA